MGNKCAALANAHHGFPCRADLPKAAEIVFDLRLVLRQEVLAGQLEHLLALVLLQFRFELLRSSAHGPSSPPAARISSGLRIFGSLSWRRAGNSRRAVPGLRRLLIAAARGLAAVGILAAAGSRFLRLLDQLSRSETICRCKCCVTAPESRWPSRGWTSRISSATCRSGSFGLPSFSGRGAKFLLKLLLHLRRRPAPCRRAWPDRPAVRDRSHRPPWNSSYRGVDRRSRAAGRRRRRESRRQ